MVIGVLAVKHLGKGHKAEHVKMTKQDVTEKSADLVLHFLGGRMEDVVQIIHQVMMLPPNVIQMEINLVARLMDIVEIQKIIAHA